MEDAPTVRLGTGSGKWERLPPGPRTPAAVQTARLIRDPIGFFHECRERYGDSATLKLLGFGPTVLFSDSTSVRRIFSESDALPIGPAANIIRDVVGDHSPTQVDGPEHMRLRRLLAPLFVSDSLNGYLPAFESAIAREVASWEQGETIVMREALQRATLDQICEIAFGFEDPEERRRMAIAVDDVRAGSALASLPPWTKRNLGPRSPWGRFVRSRERLDSLIFEQLDDRRRTGPTGPDMLSALLRAEQSTGERPLSREELRDQLKSLVMGGHETVATTVAWATGLLLAHPEHIERLADEAEAGGIEFAEALIQETMRLRPPIVATGRQTREPTEIAGWRLPAGLRVWIPAALVHHDPRSYERPLEFVPERFIGKRPDRGAWVPFGGGPHRCVGAGFARHQTRVLLQSVFRQARLRLAGDGVERAIAENVISVPRHGMRVIYEGPR